MASGTLPLCISVFFLLRMCAVSRVSVYDIVELFVLYIYRIWYMIEESTSIQHTSNLFELFLLQWCACLVVLGTTKNWKQNRIKSRRPQMENAINGFSEINWFSLVNLSLTSYEWNSIWVRFFMFVHLLKRIMYMTRALLRRTTDTILPRIALVLYKKHVLGFISTHRGY